MLKRSLYLQALDLMAITKHLNSANYTTTHTKR